MAVTTTLVNSYKKHLLQGNIDFDNDTIKVMLLDENHTTDIDAQEYIDDVSANEVSGTGYSAGGATLANGAVSQDNTNDRAKFDADDTVWTTSTIDAQYAVLYKDTGTPATSPIVGIVDFGELLSSTAADFSILWHANGILLNS